MAYAEFQQFGPNVFIHFGQSAPPPPACGKCGQPATRQTHPDGRLWCEPCFEPIKREIDARKNGGIQASVAAIFEATKPEHRKKLYRALAAVWHPDAGGDAALMVALNAVSDTIA
jgi:hypothetical protein